MNSAFMGNNDFAAGVHSPALFPGQSVKLLYLLFSLLAIACSRSKQSVDIEWFQSVVFSVDSYAYYPIKDNRITADLSRSQKASLFDYYSRIELIHLETNDDVLLNVVNHIIHYQGRYYILDSKPPTIYVFDESGKFVSKIGKRGQGQGEYTSNMTISSIHSPDI